MVQFFRSARDPRDEATGYLAAALGKGLGTAVLSHFANKAIDDLIADPENENLSSSERLEKTRSLLSRYGQPGQDVYKKRLQIEQRKQQEQEQNVLSRIMAGEKLDPKDLAALSPQTQLSAMKLLQQQQTASNKLNLDTLASNSFSKGYRAILDNDLDSLKDVISDPNTPLSVKAQLGSLQNQFSSRKDIQKRDNNRRVNSVQDAYRKAIAAERNKIGKYGGFRKEDVAAINEKIASLEAARQKDMQKLLKNPDSYGSLSIWGNANMRNYLPEVPGMGEEEEEELEEEEDFEPPAAKARAGKVRFDPRNPKHVARAKEVLAETKGDRAKANAILAEEFIK